MALTDNTLQKPMVVILPGDSITGEVSTGEINFGSIVNIYETSDRYAISDNVAYMTEGQRLVNVSRYQYAVIKEENILYKEPPPAP